MGNGRNCERAAKNANGAINVKLAIPNEMGGPGGEGTTTPEALFAAGYAACFGSAAEHVARLKKIPNKGVVVKAKVTIGTVGQGFGGIRVAMLLFFFIGIAALAVPAGALAVRLSRQRREDSRIHKANLARHTTQEIEARAWSWPYLARHEKTPAVLEFRRLLDERRYDEMLSRWRELTTAVSAVGDDPSPAKPEFYDSGSDVALRDYVEVLHERGLSG